MGKGRLGASIRERCYSLIKKQVTLKTPKPPRYEPEGVITILYVISHIHLEKGQPQRVAGLTASYAGVVEWAFSVIIISCTL